MERQSFESLIKSKLGKSGIKPPHGIWTSIAGTLNDKAISSLQSSQTKYRWIAVAAIFIAVFSFVFNFDYQTSAEVGSAKTSNFNALLPNTPDHFRFFEPESYVMESSGYHSLWSNILFTKDETNSVPIDIPVNLDSEGGVVAMLEAHEISKLRPKVKKALVTNDFDPYYVMQYRSVARSKHSRTSFWAGVEAGAGSFNPDFNGSDPIAANIDFDALASNIGQSGFVNPTSSTLQSGMNEGLVTTLGLDFGVKMGKRWTLESGVQYASIQNQTSVSLNIVDVYTIKSNQVLISEDNLSAPIVAPSTFETEVEESFEHSVDLDNNLKFTSIPLKAGYFILDSKLSLRLNAGLSANYFLGNKLTDPTGQLEAPDQSNVYNEWSFDGLTGFELGYNLFENFNLTLEPNYRQSITPLSSSLSTRSGFMVQTGFRYTIK